jgi:hypothetical protein
MATVNQILKYTGLYGFTIGDTFFFAGAFLLIMVLVKLYNKKRK